jgi:hypothetical protein
LAYLFIFSLNWGVDCHLERVIPVFPSRRDCKTHATLLEIFHTVHDMEKKPSQGSKIFFFLQNDDDMEEKA